MAVVQSIPPFPLDTDRDLFGCWLSGFADGEGCFSLTRLQSEGAAIKSSPQARFAIALRADDAAIIHQIQSFWQCGRVYCYSQSDARNSNAVCKIHVSDWAHLAATVVPHFDRHPLRSKKARDFALWREVVLLGARVAQRSRGAVPGQKGYREKWSPDERAWYASVHAEMHRQRQFVRSGGDAP